MSARAKRAAQAAYVLSCACAIVAATSALPRPPYGAASLIIEALRSTSEGRIRVLNIRRTRGAHRYIEVDFEELIPGGQHYAPFLRHFTVKVSDHTTRPLTQAERGAYSDLPVDTPNPPDGRNG